MLAMSVLSLVSGFSDFCLALRAFLLAGCSSSAVVSAGVSVGWLCSSVLDACVGSAGAVDVLELLRCGVICMPCFCSFC